MGGTSKIWAGTNSGTVTELAKQTEVNSLKSSVSSGKAQIASAITGKGVSTSSTASFSTMATNIRNIKSVSNAESLWLNEANKYLWITEFGYIAFVGNTKPEIILSPNPYTITSRYSVTNISVAASQSSPYTGAIFNFGNMDGVFTLFTISGIIPDTVGIASLNDPLSLAVDNGWSSSYGGVSTTITQARYNNYNNTIEVSFYFDRFYGDMNTNKSPATATINLSKTNLLLSYWTTSGGANPETKLGSFTDAINKHTFNVSIV